MAQLISQQFHAALCYLLKREGRGAQSRLANQQKIDRGYLNGIAKGRKPGSEKVRSKIAAYFQMTYDEMLLLGRRLLVNENIAEEQILPKHNNVHSGQWANEEANIEIKKLEVIQSQDQFRSVNIDTSVSDLIKKSADILGSNTTYRDALAKMIETLHESLTKEKENLTQQDQMKKMEQRIASLEELLDENKGNQSKFA